MNNNHIVWSEQKEVYAATYYAYIGRIIVRKADTKEIVLIYDNMSPVDWRLFKKRLVICKAKIVRDAEKD